MFCIRVWNLFRMDKRGQKRRRSGGSENQSPNGDQEEASPQDSASKRSNVVGREALADASTSCLNAGSQQKKKPASIEAAVIFLLAISL